jgi:hypothetical protein
MAMLVEYFLDQSRVLNGRLSSDGFRWKHVAETTDGVPLYSHEERIHGASDQSLLTIDLEPAGEE